MAINGLTTGINAGMSTSYESHSISAEITKTTTSTSVAAIYSKSNNVDESNANANVIDDVEKGGKPIKHKVDFDTIDKLKKEAEERTASLKSLVEKMMLKQAGTVTNSEGLASMYRKLEVDPETQAQAQKDISEGGYWSVEETADRIVSFAKALAGDNLGFAEKMLDAVKEGFKQAGQEWGEDLPEISQKTMDRVYEKMDEWIGGLKNNNGSAVVGMTTTTTTTSIKVSASYEKVQSSASAAVNKEEK